MKLLLQATLAAKQEKFTQVAENYLQELLGKNASLENIQNWLEYEKNGEFLYEILPDIKAAS